MKSFKYIVRDFSGERKEGFQQAASSNDLLASLRENGLTPVSVEEIIMGVRGTRIKGYRRRIKSAELAAVFWQMTTMLEGGIGITTAFETISEDIDNPRLQQILQQILKKIERGETLSECMGDFPRVFNSLTRALIMAGETGGTLPDSLRRLAEYYDNRDKLTRKVKGAIAYPVFVVCFIVGIVIFIMAFIIPRFRGIFDQVGSELPGFTRAFMAVYDGICANLFYILGFVFLLMLTGVLAYSKTQKGHYWFSKLFLRIPLLGRILAQAFIAMFCRTMATLIQAGVSILQIFDILAGMTSNDIIKSSITKAKQSTMEGSGVYLGLAASRFFPSMVVKMTQVGEESGSLADVLNRTADYYERKVDSAISTLMSLLEPILIVVVGAIVLVVVLALYLPIFTMSDIKK